MSYQVPQHIDPNKVFLINHSELEGRLDSMFYTRQFSDIIVALKKCFLYKRLGQVALFSSESWNQKDYYETVFPYIEIGAINITDGKIDDVSFVPVEQAPSRAKVIVRTGDIIISTTRPDRGAIIKITENENLYIASTGFSVIRNIDSNINPDYWLAILRHKLILLQMRQRSTGGNYPAITQEELSKIIIPIPPVDIQNKIVSLIESAHTKKQEADFVANSLVQSIDGYLLNELGIQVPETKSQTIQDRMFVVNFSDASGERLDPMFYAADIKKYTHCTYSESIASLTLSCNSGFAVGRQDQIDQANGILQIRPTNIDNNGQLKYDKNVYVPENNGFQFVPSGVVLFNNTNSQEWVGKTAYFSNEEKRNVYISNHITAINVDKSKILPMYLSEILNMYQRHKVFYSICTNWNNQSGIGLDLLSILHIPLFTDDRQRSLVKQQEIVDHISSIRQQAKALQEEGKAILEQAKKEVEQMILG